MMGCIITPSETWRDRITQVAWWWQVWSASLSPLQFICILTQTVLLNLVSRVYTRNPQVTAGLCRFQLRHLSFICSRFMCLDLLPPALLLCSFPRVFICPQMSRVCPCLHLLCCPLRCVYGTNRQCKCSRPVAVVLAVSQTSALMTLSPQCILVKSNSEHLEQI